MRRFFALILPLVLVASCAESASEPRAETRIDVAGRWSAPEIPGLQGSQFVLTLREGSDGITGTMSFMGNGGGSEGVLYSEPVRGTYDPPVLTGTVGERSIRGVVEDASSMRVTIGGNWHATFTR